MNKFPAFIYSVLFLLALFAVPLITLLSEDKTFSENENRYLTRKPRLSFEEILSGSFMQDTEEYVRDQFPGRDFFIAARADLTRAAGGREINGVYLGRDGYLLEKWLDSDFDPEQLMRNIEAVNRFSGQHDTDKVSVMIVPTSGFVLHDKLPENAPMFDQNTAFKMMLDNISAKAEFIDTRELMLNHRDEYIFYKTDHHWTSRGAFLAYSHWRGENGESVSEGEFKIEEATNSFKGSLYSKTLLSSCPADKIELYTEAVPTDYTVYYNFGREVSHSVYALDNLQKRDKYQVFLDGNHPEATIQTGNENGKRLLIFKDSFANSFIPFLLSDYESIHIIDLRYFISDIEDYIAENSVTEYLFLYNLKNFCEDKNLEKCLSDL